MLRVSVELGALEPDVALQLVGLLATCDERAEAMRELSGPTATLARRVLDGQAALARSQERLGEALAALAEVSRERAPSDVLVDRDAEGNVTAYRTVTAGGDDLGRQVELLHRRARNGGG
jgi:hypothetical protein